MSLEQQWQQFQQQVKMEGGQQQYDPYAAATEDSEHQDSARQSQVLTHFTKLFPTLNILQVFHFKPSSRLSALWHQWARRRSGFRFVKDQVLEMPCFH